MILADVGAFMRFVYVIEECGFAFCDGNYE